MTVLKDTGSQVSGSWARVSGPKPETWDMFLKSKTLLKSMMVDTVNKLSVYRIISHDHTPHWYLSSEAFFFQIKIFLCLWQCLQILAVKIL